MHDTTNVHVVVKNKNEKCNLNFFISYINMLKHKKCKVENIKSLTIPRKYKWRRICKDGKKKTKKITLQKLELAESFVAEENRRSDGNERRERTGN